MLFSPRMSLFLESAPVLTLSPQQNCWLPRFKIVFLLSYASFCSCLRFQRALFLNRCAHTLRALLRGEANKRFLSALSDLLRLKGDKRVMIRFPERGLHSVHVIFYCNTFIQKEKKNWNDRRGR